MAFLPIRRILPSAIRESGIESQVSAIRILEEAKASLVRLWGPEQAAFVEPVSYAEGTLNVEIHSPSAAHALTALQSRWVNEMNRALGAKKIVKINVRRKGF